jgi:hypothetical protein
VHRTDTKRSVYFLLLHNNTQKKIMTMATTNANETYCTFTLASDVTAGGLPSEEDIAKDLESNDDTVRGLPAFFGDFFHVIVIIIPSTSAVCVGAQRERDLCASSLDKSHPPSLLPLMHRPPSSSRERKASSIMMSTIPLSASGTAFF